MNLKLAISKAWFTAIILTALMCIFDESTNTQLVYNIRANSTVVIDILIDVKGKTVVASGSGSIIRDDGLILTADHVIDGAKDIVVTTTDGNKYKAKVVKHYASRDLAVIKILNAKRGTKFRAVSLADSDSIKVGMKTIVVGYPFALTPNVLSTGVVSKISADDAAFLTDAAVNHGNSGGPVFDRFGRQVGVVSAMFAQADQNAGVNLIMNVNIITNDLRRGEI